MHSRDPDKDAGAFRTEIDAILAGNSSFHRSVERFDFRGFAFPKYDFSVKVFNKWVDFRGSVFAQEAEFRFTRFSQGADFCEATFTKGADFRTANFIKWAGFRRARFIMGGDFRKVTFSEEGDLSRSVFGPGNGGPTETQESESAVADFRGATFLKPELVRFLQVNRNGGNGLRARFVNCLIKGVRFEDVHWHRESGRMVLQDELDRLANAGDAASYEQVAAAYRRFVINFDETKQYELAEDCMIGAMETKRRDPSHFLFSKWLRPYYERCSWLRRLGEQVSVTNLYRLASNYGSSYVLAFWVLLLLLIVFALLLTLAGVTCTLVPEGLIHSIEVATFQRQARYEVGNGLGWSLEHAERLLVAAQAALLLLALRRRFRR
ncbi:MAG: hypothetical protein AAB308_17670 [Nitrospirota bacterium]